MLSDTSWYFLMLLIRSDTFFADSELRRIHHYIGDPQNLTDFCTHNLSYGSHPRAESLTRAYHRTSEELNYHGCSRASPTVGTHKGAPFPDFVQWNRHKMNLG